MTDTYTPVDDKTAISMIGEGVHAGLRKGSEAADSGALWRAIMDSQTTAWRDAVRFCVEGLRYMGYAVVKVEKGTD